MPTKNKAMIKKGLKNPQKKKTTKKRQKRRQTRD